MIPTLSNSWKRKGYPRPTGSEGNGMSNRRITVIDRAPSIFSFALLVERKL
jgi:hypothetical protein